MLRNTLFVMSMLSVALLVGCGGGNTAKKQKTLSEQQAIAMAMTNPDTRATELVKVAELQFSAGEHSGARSSLNAAQMAISEIPDNSAKAATGITIATALAKHDMAMEAKNLLKEVRTAIEADPNPATRSASLGRMALVYGAGLKNETAAEAYLADAAKLIDEIPNTIDRVNALLEIGTAYQQINRTEAAEAQFTTAANLAATAATPREQSDLLVVVANRMESLELKDRAKQVREQARGIAESVADDFSRGYAILNVALSYQKAGDNGTANKLLAAAEKSADKVADLGLKGELMSAINRGKGF